MCLHSDEKFAVPESSEQNPVNSPHEPTDGKESSQSDTDPENDATEDEVNTSSEATELWKTFVDSLILVSCANSILLFSTKSLIQVPTWFYIILLLSFCYSIF